MRTPQSRLSFLAFAVGVGAVSACTGTSSPAGSGAVITGPPAPNAVSAIAAGPEVKADDPQALTPVLAHVPFAPVPFAGSDGKTHAVYELFVSNAKSSKVFLDQLNVIDAATGKTVLTLDKATLAKSLELLGSRTPGDGSLGAAQSGTVYLNVLFSDASSVPKSLTHKLLVTFPDAPAEMRSMEEIVAPVHVNNRAVPVLGPPLRGTGYIAADGCCTSSRHRRAALPINGSLSIGQRYAIDWEQTNEQGKIWVGERTDPKSYFIFGDEILAVADGTVVKVLDGLPEQVPGKFPEKPKIEEVDGNSVVIDLGSGNFVMYGHMQPGSPRVKVGQKVKRGDVLGLVGNSGNSLAPHLHIQLMDSPLPLAASGLPYTIDSFSVSGQTVSTEAFDKAEGEGIPLKYTPANPPTSHRNQYPMDQSIVTMGGGTGSAP